MSSTSFIQLFSDESATPNPDFILQLEKQFVNTAIAKAPRITLSRKQKILLITTILDIILAVFLLIFFPARDMSDPTTSSIVETVVDTSQQNIEPFSLNAGTNQPDTNSTNSTTDQTAPQSNTTTPSNPASVQNQINQQQPTAPLPLSDYSVSYWNLDPDSAVAPDIPTTPPDATAQIANIDFNWGISNPTAGIYADGFVARFTKESSNMSGQYKVEYSSDNGLRIHVNETVVFDYWNSASSNGIAYFTTDSANPVTSITIDYYESDGPANISVKITKIN